MVFSSRIQLRWLQAGVVSFIFSSFNEARKQHILNLPRSLHRDARDSEECILKREDVCMKLVVLRTCVQQVQTSLFFCLFTSSVSVWAATFIVVSGRGKKKAQSEAVETKKEGMEKKKHSFVLRHCVEKRERFSSNFSFFLFQGHK